MNVDELDLTIRLVYGTSTLGTNPNSHIRENIPASAPPAITYSMADYLTTGAGRYALPSRAPIIDAFFGDALSLSPTLANGTYTLSQLRTALGLTAAEGSTNFTVSQYVTDALSSDFIERAYVFGSTAFTLADTLTFTVNNGTYTVNDLEVRAFNDNFDFQSSNPIASIANVALRQAFDPYGLIPEVSGATLPVDIVYTGTGRQYTSYSLTNYVTDSALDVGYTASAAVAPDRFAAALSGLATNSGYLGSINSNDLFRYYTSDNKKVVYGTPDDDNITPLSAEVTVDLYFAYQMVGGQGNDTIEGSLLFGDELWGGQGNDTLRGSGGNDTFYGGEGNDQIGGGNGDEDVSSYLGVFSDYKIQFFDDRVVITDGAPARDGEDTLTNTEVARFSDKSVNIEPGQDIAFVIDTTGSMFDDIDAAQAASTSIVNAIFDPDRGLLNSRVAVVGYNDPFTETILSFTSQPDAEDRKAAALNAINGISVGGGGDIPELTYSGLLRALSGGAGEWREDAKARKIVLFGDAPAKDASLASQVYALASNLNVDVSASFAAPLVASQSVFDEITLTSLAVTEAEAVIPVQIFTVAIGTDPAALAEFEEIADATGGAAFRAADASEIVEALLEVINLPIYSIAAEFASVEEGDSGTRAIEFTISRDVADAVALVELGRSGTADDADVSDVPNSVTFAEGEFEKAFSVSVNGDTGFEDDETLVLSIASVDEPATFGATTAQVLILNDDEEAGGEISGTEENDNLIGTEGPDVIRSLGGSYDRMTGGEMADTFIFGAEANNGVRERDVIRDYEVGVDTIQLEAGATIGAIRASSTGATIFLAGDGDAIYVQGDGVTPENLTILEDDVLLV